MANHLKAAAQAKKNSKYWQKRLRDPLYKAYNENEKATRAWLHFYEDAKKDIDAELMDVYKQIGKDDPKISDFYRSNHLEKIEKQIEKSLEAIGNKEDTYLKGKIKDGVTLGSKTVSDALQTSMLNKRAIDQLIKQPWQDGDFSSRIWDNKAQLISSMKSELTAGIVKGDGIYKVADRLDKRLDVGKSQTQRLARTEYMHALNAGQLETYRENGYDKLEWVASEDGRGCDTCHIRNGKQYSINDVPVLPAHPNCRCTMIPVITDEMIEEQAKELEEAQSEESAPEWLDEAKEQINKTNMAESVGEENFNKFIQGLSEIENDDLGQLFAKHGGQLDFFKIKDRGKAFARDDKVQLLQKSFDGDDKAKGPLETVFHEIGHAFDHVGLKESTGKDKIVAGTVKKKGRRGRGTVEVNQYVGHMSGMPEYDLKNKIDNDLWKYVNGDLPTRKSLGKKPRKKAEKQAWEDERSRIFKESEANFDNFYKDMKQLQKDEGVSLHELSDIAESTGYLPKSLGSGHGDKYWKDKGNAETEFFAHMTETYAVNRNEFDRLEKIFPEATKTWKQMVQDMLKG
ncbi:phage head morphogenesis protein [Tetragenococcus muriaticus]|uniref:Phage protein n=1 Tax=Tetragenococcus muriaticus 3MR10-3 TaxID=1302648 RepID=A0A091C5F8_9ENTE|nr:phage head morphogenesis protein [Tetragenococcus muriaticus]KFN92164.1 phage protein [Tetragenococcus muriaticus 3MR10-3]